MLLGNYSVLHKSPAKYLTGTVGFNDRANWNKPGMMRSRGAGVAMFAFDAVPAGFMAGKAFFAPRTAGRIVTRNAFAVDGAAVGAMGLPGAAAASFAVNGAAIGGLIAGGVANASFTITGTASIAGLAAGSAAGTIAVNASAIGGATAWGIASGTMTVTGYCQPYALGYMTATTVDSSVLTPVSVASAVWAATAATNNTVGSMGEKLNDAGSAANPWTEVIESGYTAADILRLLASHAAGMATGLEGATPRFKSLDGTKIRIDGTYAAGERGITSLDAS